MFQFLCECSLGYEQLIEKIKMGGYGAGFVSKVIWKSDPSEQQFSINNSGIFERSFWRKHPVLDSARSEIF